MLTAAAAVTAAARSMLLDVPAHQLRPSLLKEAFAFSGFRLY
jgi:ABC-type branched-subunit amino acid transport system ATPase component